MTKNLALILSLVYCYYSLLHGVAAYCSGTILPNHEAGAPLIEWEAHDGTILELILSSRVNRSQWVGIELGNEINQREEEHVIIVAGVDYNGRVFTDFVVKSFNSQFLTKAEKESHELYYIKSAVYNEKKLLILKIMAYTNTELQYWLTGSIEKSFSNSYYLLHKKEQLSDKPLLRDCPRQMTRHKIHKRSSTGGLNLPSIEISMRDNVTLYTGSLLLLKCSLNLTSLNTPPSNLNITNKWLIDNTLIRNNTRTSSCASWVDGRVYVTELLVYPLNDTVDSGLYQCNMTVCVNDSNCDMAVSTGLHIKVNELPLPSVSLTASDDNSTLSRLSLQCNITTVNRLVPILEWYYGEDLISSSSNNFEELVITEPDRGVYTCQAKIEIDVINLSIYNKAVYGYFQAISSNLMSSTLTFNTLKFTDTDSYTCTAVVNSLTDSDTVMVTVELPSLSVDIVSDYNGTLYTGTPLSLTCTINISTIDTSLTVTNTWIKGNTIIPTNSSSKIVSCLTMIATNVYNATIYFNPLDSTVDNGIYTCNFTVSSNLLTENSTVNRSIPVTVNALPSPSVDITVHNTTASHIFLHCNINTVKLLALPKLEWFYNDHLISSSFNTLEVLSVDSFKAGQYTCRGTIVLGGDINITVTNSDEYTVDERDKIDILISQNGDTVYGNWYELVCTTNGTTGQPNVTWTHNGSPINQSIINTTSYTVNTVVSIVRFDALKFTDNGKYECSAELNRIKKERAVNVTVKLPSLSVDIVSDYNGTLYTGTPLSLTCTINMSTIDTSLTVTNTWIKGNTMIPTNSSSRIVSCLTMIATNVYNATIYFNPLDSTVDNGIYTCNFTVSSNLLTENSTVNRSIPVMVYDIPPLSVTLELINTSISNITLRCTITTVSRLRATTKFQLIFGDNLLSSSISNTNYFKDFQLDLSHLVSGIYVCNATIDVQGVNMSVFNSGNYELILPDSLSVDISSQGEPVFGNTYQLICTVNGTVPPKIYWINNDTEINSSSTVDIKTVLSGNSITSILTFKSLKFAHEGRYTCMGLLMNRNITLTDNDTMTVSVKLPSLSVDIVSDYNGTLYTGTPLSLTCTINMSTIDTSLTVTNTWIRNESFITNSSRVSLHHNERDNNMYISRAVFYPLYDTIDNGVYTCNYTVQSGLETINVLNSINITVYSLPPIIIDLNINTNNNQSVLHCIISAPDRLIVSPLLRWSRPQSAPILQFMETRSDNISFNNTQTSSAGLYICYGSINIDSINLTVSNSSSINHTLQIPPPSVQTTTAQSSDSGFFYEDTPLNVTCTVHLSHLINTPVNVSIIWSNSHTGNINGEGNNRINIETIKINQSYFESSLNISPLLSGAYTSTNDSGRYTCQVMLSSNDEFLLDSSNSSSVNISVQVLPPFIANISTSGLNKYNSHFTIHCSGTLISGLLVPPNITLSKEGSNDSLTHLINRIDSGQHSILSLTFSHVSFDHRGLYSCMVRYESPGSNRTDMSVESYSLNLTVPSVLVTVSAKFNGVGVAGVPLALTCNINTSSLENIDINFPITIYWRHNQSMLNISEISSNGNVPTKISQFLYRHVIDFNPSQTNDSGEYDCIVRVGKDEDYIKSSIANSSTVVIVNDTPPLNVSITTKGLISFNFSYTLTCSIQLIEGFISLPHIQWTKKGNNQQALLLSSNNDTDGILELPLTELSTNDTGRYVCSVRLNVSQIGLNMSSDASHDIVLQIPEPQVSLEPSRTGNLTAGSNLTLNCIITTNLSDRIQVTTHPKVTWKKNDNIITSNQRIVISELTNDAMTYTSRLIFTSLSSDLDSANYSCTVQLITGSYSHILNSSSVRRTVGLNVTNPVISYLSVTPTSFTGLESTCPDSYPYHNLTLTCTATFPYIQYQSPNTLFSLLWYHNGTIRPSNLTVYNGGLTLVRTIHIANASITDSGLYTCIGVISLLESSNVSQTATSQVLIEGNNRPHPVTIETISTTSTSVNISFSVNNISYTQEKYQVTYQGLKYQTTISFSESLPGPTDIKVKDQLYSIVITGLEEANNYTFSVIASNCIGNTSSVLKRFVTQESLPIGSPKNINATVIGSRSVTLKWREPNEITQNGLILHYHLLCRNTTFNWSTNISQSATPIHVLLMNLAPFSRYSCDVAAVNSKGQGPFVSYQFMTLPEAPSDTPVNVIVSSSTPFSLTYTWSPPKTPNGLITGYTLTIAYNNASQSITRQVSNETLSFKLDKLLPYQLITLRISAISTGGVGPVKELSQRTKEYKPDPVNNLRYTVIDDTAITIHWESVTNANGNITSYQLNVTDYNGTLITAINTSSVTFRASVSGLVGLRPYVINIWAVNGAPDVGINTRRVFFTRESAPPSPKNVTAQRLNGTHMYINWEPIPITEAKGIIKFYRIILQVVSNSRKKRQTQSFEVSANQSSVIIGGLNPGLSYRIFVDATTNAGPGPIATPPSLPPSPGSSLFQVKAGDFDSCTSLNANSQTIVKTFFNNSISKVINDSCSCNFDATYITEDRLVCDQSQQSRITYRARIVDFKEFKSTQLVNFIQTWINTNPKVPNSVVIISFDSSCPVSISTYNDPICSNDGTITSATDSQSFAPAAAGGAAVGVIVLVIVIGVIGVIVFVIYKRKRSAKFRTTANKFDDNTIAMTNMNEAYGSSLAFRSLSTLRPLPNPLDEQYETPHIPEGYNDEIYEQLDDNNEKDTLGVSGTDVCVIPNTYTALNEESAGGDQLQEPPTYMECIGANDDTKKDSNNKNDTSSKEDISDTKKNDTSTNDVKNVTSAVVNISAKNHLADETNPVMMMSGGKEGEKEGEGGTCIANDYFMTSGPEEDYYL